MEISIKQRQEFNKKPINELKNGEAGLIYGSVTDNGSIIIKLDNSFYKIYSNTFYKMWEKDVVPSIFYLPIRKLELQYTLE